LPLALHRILQCHCTTIAQYTPPPRPPLALPWRVFLEPPACILPVSCLYLTVSLVSRCTAVSSHSAVDPLCPAVSHCIQLYSYVSSYIPAVSAVSRCISSYLTASKTGYGQKYTPGEGSPFVMPYPIIGMAISCKGQAAARLSGTLLDKGSSPERFRLTVASRIRPNEGFGETPGNLLTLK